MKRYATPGGWEIFRGREWVLHRSLGLSVSSALEAVRFSHFDGTESMKDLDWVLDCHFAPHMRYRSGTSRWKLRPAGIWHLYGPKACWYQDSRRSKLPLHALWVRFQGCEKLGLDRLVNNPSGMARIHDPHGWLTEQVRSLARLGDTADTTEGEYPRVLSIFTEILYRLLHSQALATGEYRLKTTNDTAPDDPLVAGVKDYLAAHLREPLTLPLLARHFHTSVSTLHRRFEASSKESITQTLIRLRIERVKMLLTQGATISQAAYSTGFYDPHHLSKTFRRIEGIPPREFISRLRSKTRR